MILDWAAHYTKSIWEIDSASIALARSIMEDPNYNYTEKYQTEKKSKGGRIRAFRRMTQNAAKIATDMTRLVTGADFTRKAIKPQRVYDNVPFGEFKLSSILLKARLGRYRLGPP